MISFLPGLKSAGGTEEILRNTDRRARARAAARAAPGQGHPVLRAAFKGRSSGMNLALSDEQVFLREAARGALSRFKTLEAAREALDGERVRAARPVADRRRGRLARTADRRGPRRRRAGRVRRDAGARRVRPRARRRRRCSGTCPPRAILNDGAGRTPPMLEELASGERRAAYLPVQPARRPRRALDGRPGPRRRTRPAPPAAVADGGQAQASPASSRSCRTRPAPTCSWAWRCSTGRAPVGVGDRGERRRRDDRAGRAATTPPARSAHVSLTDAPATRAGRARGRRSRAPGTWRSR